MASVPFHLLDVFTDRPFGGNQLAVVRLEAAIPDGLMQQIAAEFNLSETVFVLPDGGDAHWRLRIFTPRFELPFAGHPTIGAAVLLGGETPSTLRLRENVGVVTVAVQPGRAELTVDATPEFRPVSAGRERLADVLGLPPAAVVAEPVAASVGVPFLMIMLHGEEALDAAVCNEMLWQQHVASEWAPHLYPWCLSGSDDVSARMFAPAMGIREDPATGAAAGALGALFALATPAPDIERTIRVRQGVQMGRPSVIDVSLEKRAGTLVSLRIGGSAVRIASGSLEIPA